MPEISVIIPVYNTKPQYLTLAIGSILQQTFTDFELLIIDDCSTEDIFSVIKNFSDPRIIFIRAEKNGGAGQARNLGLSLAKGKYIALMDSDDISRPNRLAVEHRYMEKHPEIDILGSYMQRFPQKKTLKVPLTHNDIIHENIFLNCAMNNPSVIFRANPSIHYNNKLRVSEDYDMWLRQADKSRFANLPAILMNYRWEGQNISILQNDKQVLAAAQMQSSKWIEIAGYGTELQSLLINFISKKPLTDQELANITDFISAMLKKLENHPHYNRPTAEKYLQKLLKRIIRKTPDKDYARRLCFSSLAKKLKLPWLFTLTQKLSK